MPFGLGGRFQLIPGQAGGHREGAEYFQDVRQLAGQLGVGGLTGLSRLLSQLGQQRDVVAGPVQHPGDRPVPARPDEAGDPVPDELVVLNPHAWTVTGTER